MTGIEEMSSSRWPGFAVRPSLGACSILLLLLCRLKTGLLQLRREGGGR